MFGRELGSRKKGHYCSFENIKGRPSTGRKIFSFFFVVVVVVVIIISTNGNKESSSGVERPDLARFDILFILFIFISIFFLTTVFFFFFFSKNMFTNRKEHYTSIRF